jgi:RNA polymerase sigma-70 factor (ECF subfamily)
MISAAHSECCVLRAPRPSTSGLLQRWMSRAESDDDDFIGRLRTMQPRAFEELIALYRPRIQALAFRFTGNHHDAEDITQETFLRFVRAMPRYRSDAKLSTWLHAIAINVARNRHRYWQCRKRGATLSLDAPLGPAERTSLHDVVSVNAATGYTEAVRSDFRERITASMARLSEKDRRILTLRDRDHASYAEIGRVLGIAMGTVKSRIARARARLRALLLGTTPRHQHDAV